MYRLGTYIKPQNIMAQNNGVHLIMCLVYVQYLVTLNGYRKYTQSLYTNRNICFDLLPDR